MQPRYFCNPFESIADSIFKKRKEKTHQHRSTGLEWHLLPFGHYFPSVFSGSFAAYFSPPRGPGWSLVHSIPPTHVPSLGLLYEIWEKLFLLEQLSQQELHQSGCTVLPTICRDPLCVLKSWKAEKVLITSNDWIQPCRSQNYPRTYCQRKPTNFLCVQLV